MIFGMTGFLSGWQIHATDAAHSDILTVLQKCRCVDLYSVRKGFERRLIFLGSMIFGVTGFLSGWQIHATVAAHSDILTVLRKFDVSSGSGEFKI